MIAAPILNTEARIVARHCAFAGFSIPLEANDTQSPTDASFSVCGADVAHNAPCAVLATSAAVPFFHATLTSDEG